MEKIRHMLTRLPPGFFSIPTVAAILWLTLASKPLGENPPQLFPGADKVVHAIMFGGLSLMMLLDYQRRRRWIPVSVAIVILIALTASVFGVVIEFLQRAMDAGRGFELADMTADAAGAFLCAMLWIVFQRQWAE